jgi:hypothetical protein
MLLPYDCHPGNTAISMSLAGERAEDARHAADLAKGIIRPRRSVQDCGAGVGSAPVAGCSDAPAAGGRGVLAEGAATGERDQER